MASVFVGQDPLIKLALGTGKAAQARFSLEPLKDVVNALRGLDKDISTKYQLQALKKASKIGKDALKNQVAQIGSVTGNLLASVTEIPRKYTNNKRRIPVGVVVVGFRRPTNAKSQKMATPAFVGGTVLKGPNRAYHSHLVEYGTQRRTPGKTRRINRRRVVLGGRVRTLADTIKQLPANPRGILSSFVGRGKFLGGRRGQYPKDFIATGSVGPSPARRPLQKAFEASEQRMKSVLDASLRAALQKALRDHSAKFKAAGGYQP
jgi:hypothetical protein